MGKTLKGVRVKILKETKNKSNKVGKILLSGTSLMNGYFNLKKNNKKFHKGWFVTGDLGFYRNNQIYLVGREDNTFSVGMKNYAQRNWRFY